MRITLLCLALFTLCVASAGAVQGRFERMAALQETIVSIHENNGIPGLFTYYHDPNVWLDYLGLGRLKVGIRSGQSTLWLSDAADLKVRNTPGGESVDATGTVGGVRLKVEAIPTAAGRDTMRWEGSAIFKITAPPSTKLVFEWGGIRRSWWAFRREGIPSRTEYMLEPDILASDCTRTDGDDLFSNTGLGITSAVRVTGRGVNCSLRDGVLHCEAEGDVYLVAGFAEQRARARELAAVDARAAERECRQRFAALTDSAWIKTNSPELDGAFRAAAINLEYNWVRPFGWIEAINHWATLYSQQQNLAADWFGQHDRSKEMLLTHAKYQLPSGQIPQLDTHWRPRVDFGGWNQFYVWGVQHYWEQTGDKDFLEKIRGPLDRVVSQTITAHDADGNGLLGFGQQIGNQEDYITTPEDGTSPTIAAIEMKRIQSELAVAQSGNADAGQARDDVLKMTSALKASLWNTDLGRFIFYRDLSGKPHIDGQYHTLIWPVMFDIVNKLDGYTSMRHLRDTLTDPTGGIFCSNNFPTHVQATVGSQAGGQQQPWATLGWSKLGYGDEAIRPLKWIARRVMNEANAGSWPEVAEDWPSYFSPPEGVYVQGVVEGLFGLKLNKPALTLSASPKPAQTLSISPCLARLSSEFMPKAQLHLPDFDMTITQSSRKAQKQWCRIECKSRETLRREFRVPIPPAARVSAKLNGKPVAFHLEAGVGCQFVCFGASRTRSSIAEISWSPVSTGNLPRLLSVSPDETVIVPTGGLSVHRIADPSGALAESRIDDDEVLLHIRRGLASEAEAFGEQGRRSLTRRTVFLYAETGSHSGFWQPLDFEVVPAVRFTQPPKLVRTNGKWFLQLAATDGIGPNGLEFGQSQHRLSWAERQTTIELTERELNGIHPGRNAITLWNRDGIAKAYFDGSPLFADDADRRAFAATKMIHVPLPQALLSPDTGWRAWKWWSTYGHFPWAALEPPLQGIEPNTDLAPPTMPGLTFANPNGKVSVVSRYMGCPSAVIPVNREARKVYLLVLGLLDNQDVFSQVGKISVKCGDGIAYSRDLHFPGDLDWWCPKRIVGGFASVGQNWSDSIAWEAPSSVMSLIEVDLKAMRWVDSLTVETAGRYPALGIVGVTVLGDAKPEDIAMLTGRARLFAESEPRTLFAFPTNSLEGWEIAGKAWGIADTRGDNWGRHGSSLYFANSMAGGESATGTMLSPPFKLTGSQLTFLTNGHGARNYFSLVDAADGSELQRASAPEKTGAFTKVIWDISGLRGREVRFKAVDAEDGQSYAWIAFDAIRMVP